MYYLKVDQENPFYFQHMHSLLTAYTSENISFPEFSDFMMNPKADIS